VTNTDSYTDIAEKHRVAGVLNASAIGKRDVIEKAVLRALLALADSDPERVMIPVEDTVQKSRVGASDRSADLYKGAGSEIANSPEADSEDLGVEHVVSMIELVVLDETCVIHCKLGAPASAGLIVEWLEVHSAPRAGHRVQRREGRQPLTPGGQGTGGQNNSGGDRVENAEHTKKISSHALDNPPRQAVGSLHDFRLQLLVLLYKYRRGAMPVRCR
jgi:hypothetical protein